MTDKPPVNRFTLNPPQTSFTLRDLDNAAPMIPPPRIFQLNHPRLAPPGMAGVKAHSKRFHAHATDTLNVNVNVKVSGAEQNYRPPPAPSLPKEPMKLGQHNEATKVFKPLVSARDKGPGRGR